MSDDPLADALDALLDLAIQLHISTNGTRTIVQERVLDRARQVLEENGRDARAFD